VIRVDKNTWLPADDSCTENYYIGFLDGTVPNATCSHMGESPQNFFQRLFGGGNKDQNQPTNPQQPNAPEAPKKNIFQRLFGGGNKEPQQANPPQQ
jgi:penicillin-binding protein 1B